MSRAMFAGIFIVVGWGSVEGNSIVHKTLYLLRDRRMTPSTHPLYNISRRSILRFVAIQWLFFAAIIAISETIGASLSRLLSLSSARRSSRSRSRAAGIGFPVIIIILIPVRYYLVPRMFTPEELLALDAPTANSAAVLVSLGGPLQPEYGQARPARHPADEEAVELGAGRTSAKDREQDEGLRRRVLTEEVERERGVVGGESGLQREGSLKR